MTASDTLNLTLNVNGKSFNHDFVFKPFQSIVVKISPKGKMSFIDISFIPKEPVVRPREEQRMHF